MTLSRARLLMSAIVVAILLLYGAAGHGLHQMSTDEAMAGAVAALCLLLVTVVGCTTVRAPETDRERRFGERPAKLIVWPSDEAIDRRARASPSTLQRFRN
ncbi:MAG: hypothetical protein H0V58_08555 [Actinobacteria bacterium]|nr:hypothetical protein [Actinomycetota bacterium]